MSFLVHGHGNVTFVKQGWLLMLEIIKLLWLLIVFKAMERVGVGFTENHWGET